MQELYESKEPSFTIDVIDNAVISAATHACFPIAWTSIIVEINYASNEDKSLIGST